MSETLIESKAPADVQAKAQAMGWIPPGRYRGEPERFTDAQEYLDRGEQVLPIVRAHNQRLQGELASVREEQAATKKALESAQKAIEEIGERHSVETQRAVERAKVELKARLAAASEAGDHEAIAEITGLMVDLKAAVAPAKPEPTPTAATVDPVTPELKAWNEANPWFGTDRRRTALALGVAQELRDAGTELKGVAFFEHIKEEVEATFGARSASASKVEGGRGSDDAPRSGGKSYAALPADAKAACDADTKNFVGPDKRYKTAAEWQKRYAELYFES